MQIKDIYQKLQTKFKEQIIELVELEEGSDSFIDVNPNNIKEIAMFLRDDNEMQFDYLTILSGMDYKDTLGVVYHLYSIHLNHKLVLKVKLDRIKPIVPSIERIWKTANWHEREVYDMFGIEFEGHPNLERILCPDDWEGFPLRKDYIAPKKYHNIDATPNEA